MFCRWADRRTRALFVDFVLFNAYTNLFTIVKFVFEVPACGGLVESHDIDSIRLYTYVGEAGLVLLIMQLLWLLIFLVSTVREIRILLKDRKAYCSSGWNCLKLSNVAVVCVAIAAFTLKSVYIQLTVEEVKNNIGEYDMPCANWCSFFKCNATARFNPMLWQLHSVIFCITVTRVSVYMTIFMESVS